MSLATEGSWKLASGPSCVPDIPASFLPGRLEGLPVRFGTLRVRDFDVFFRDGVARAASSCGSTPTGAGRSCSMTEALLTGLPYRTGCLVVLPDFRWLKEDASDGSAASDEGVSSGVGNCVSVGGWPSAELFEGVEGVVSVGSSELLGAGSVCPVGSMKPVGSRSTGSPKNSGRSGVLPRSVSAELAGDGGA